MYSCALWSSAEGGVRGDLTPSPSSPSNALETAQLRKINHVLLKARLRPGHRLLEFGSGWGGLAIVAARSYGCKVDTLTLSVEQKRLAEERIEKAGLSDSITVHLMDYRDIPEEWEGAFDAFVSVEMLEVCIIICKQDVNDINKQKSTSRSMSDPNIIIPISSSLTSH